MQFGPLGSFDNKQNTFLNKNENKSKNTELDLKNLDSYEFQELDLTEVSFDFFTKHATIINDLNSFDTNISPNIKQIFDGNSNKTGKLTDVFEKIKPPPKHTNSLFDSVKIRPNYNAPNLGQDTLFVNIGFSKKNSLSNISTELKINDNETDFLLVELSLFAERLAKGEFPESKGTPLRLVNVEKLEDGSHKIKAYSKADRKFLKKMREDGGSITIQNADNSRSSINLQNATISKMDVQEYQRYTQIFNRMINDIIQRLADEKRKAAEKQHNEPILSHRASKVEGGSTVKGKDKEKIDGITLFAGKIMKNLLHRLQIDKEKNEKAKTEKEEAFREETKKNYRTADQKKEELKVLASQRNVAVNNAKKVVLLRGKRR